MPTERDRAYAELRQMITKAGLLDPALTYYAWRTSLSFVLLVAGVAAGLVLPGRPVTLLLTSLLLAFGSVQVALIGHDAGHLAVFGSARSNRNLGWLCWSFLLGISFSYWCDRHNRHHANTNDLAADPDLQWAELVAYSDGIAAARPQRARWLIRHQAVLGPGLRAGTGVSFPRRRLELRDPSVVWSATGCRACLAASTLVWLLPIVAVGWIWLGDFLLAQVLAGVYLAMVIAPNHKGMPTWPTGAALSFLERQVRSSRNVQPHPITDFVFGSLNYQIEHHLFPTMPRVHFSRARMIIKPFCLTRGLAYEEMALLPSYRLVLSELRRVGRSAAEAAPQTPRASATGPTVK